MIILNFGLQAYQKAAMDEYFAVRATMNPEERAKLEDPVEYKDEAIRSRWFAFWFVLRKIIQDRPIFFWGGVAGFVFVAVQNIVSLFIKIFA